MLTKKLFFIVVSLSLILSGISGATELSYELEDLGSGQWISRYLVTNDTLGESLAQFVIWYEPLLYENLTVVSDPEIGYDWYQDTIEPDPVWLYYGAYRALAWADGIADGEYESGFAVMFTYLGVGDPGPQEFDIVDPVEYVSLEAGLTMPTLYVDDDALGNPIQTGTSEYPFGEYRAGCGGSGGRVSGHCRAGRICRRC